MYNITKHLTMTQAEHASFSLSRPMHDRIARKVARQFAAGAAPEVAVGLAHALGGAHHVFGCRRARQLGVAGGNRADDFFMFLAHLV